MFSKNNVRLAPALLERVRAAAQKAGYSSVDEFVAHAAEKHLASLEEAGAEEALAKEAVVKQLKGLGYLE
jgi:hypothetical protein